MTLGATGKVSGDRHPKLGSGVLVGAGAYIIGNIYIGDNAKLGCGSVVLKDIPAGATAVGAPAKVIGSPYPCRSASAPYCPSSSPPLRLHPSPPLSKGTQLARIICPPWALLLRIGGRVKQRRGAEQLLPLSFPNGSGGLSPSKNTKPSKAHRKAEQPGALFMLQQQPPTPKSLASQGHRQVQGCDSWKGDGCWSEECRHEDQQLCL